MWIALNLFAVELRWDPYPFILLNLAFSTQAAYAAPLILLAQNRQENRDRVALEEDRRRAAQTKADTEYLARELAAAAAGRRRGGRRVTTCATSSTTCANYWSNCSRKPQLATRFQAAGPSSQRLRNPR